MKTENTQPTSRGQKPSTHWRQSWIQQGQLCWKSTVAETGNKSATKSTVAVYVQLCCRYGRLCHQCVRGESNTVDTIDFVDFQQVDRVEINFVVSVYRALDTTVSFLTIEWIHSTASGFTSLRYDASVRGKVGACESWMWITPQLFHISRPRLLPKILWLFMHNS